MGKSHLKDEILLKIAKFIAVMAIKLIYLTCKKNFTPTEVTKDPCVVVFWHGRLALMCYAYKHWWVGKNSKEVKVIISDHKDGELITRVMLAFGIGSVRGSSKKGAAKALIGAFKEIKNGNDVIITPDGPRGPKHSISDGPVIIAKKMNLKIYALNYEASRFWEFNSWDGMILPKPFSTINYSLSKPLDISELDNDKAKELIKTALFEARDKDLNFD
ncbi:MAG: lysophospholipid acyltransferase family protein [Campylobacter sp.]|nr:lysophospholipid acyltransferase family protein [Campylobacter sp.]